MSTKSAGSNQKDVSRPKEGPAVGGEVSTGLAAKPNLEQAEAAAAHLAPALTKRGTPRQRAPKGTFNRKAYQREKARERRARLKAAQEQPK